MAYAEYCTQIIYPQFGKNEVCFLNLNGHKKVYRHKNLLLLRDGLVCYKKAMLELEDLYKWRPQVNRPDEKVEVGRTKDGWWFTERKPEWMETEFEITSTRGELAIGLILQNGSALVGKVGNDGEFVAFDIRDPILV